MIGAILLILAIIAAIVGGIVLLVLYNKKMARLRAEWATRRGLVEYNPVHEKEWLQSFEAWGPGHGHRCHTGYQGVIDGVRVSIFVHRSKTRNKDSETVHNFLVCQFEAPLSAPRLRIKREHIGHKLFDALGGEDIDFESDEFSRKFWVKSKDRRFAYDVIHPRAMEYLLASPKLHWEWQGQRFVIHISGGFKLDRADELIDNGLGFLKLIPSHLAT